MADPSGEFQHDYTCQEVVALASETQPYPSIVLGAGDIHPAGVRLLELLRERATV